jgi:hypothetical protein
MIALNKKYRFFMEKQFPGSASESSSSSSLGNLNNTHRPRPRLDLNRSNEIKLSQL